MRKKCIESAYSKEWRHRDIPRIFMLLTSAGKVPLILLLDKSKTAEGRRKRELEGNYHSGQVSAARLTQFLQVAQKGREGSRERRGKTSWGDRKMKRLDPYSNKFSDPASSDGR